VANFPDTSRPDAFKSSINGAADLAQ